MTFATPPALSKFPFLFLSLCLGFLLGGATGCKTAKESEGVEAKTEDDRAAVAETAGDRMIVDVDGATLNQEELDRQTGYAMAARNMGDMPPQFQSPDVVERIRGEVIDRFIAQNVLLNEADRRKISADKADVEQAIQEVSAGLPPGMTLQEALEGYGLSLERFREDVRNDIRIRKLLDDRTADVAQPTDAEISGFYDESRKYFEAPASAHTRHILVRCDRDASAETHAKQKEKAEDIRRQLKEGAAFAELAGKESDCPSGKQGGDLGNLQRGQTVKEFEEAAFSQPLNEAGPVVQTQFGYHVIEVLARTEAHTKPLADVREDIAEFLTDRKKQEAIEKYIQDLRSQATIRYGDDSVREDSGN